MIVMKEVNSGAYIFTRWGELVLPNNINQLAHIVNATKIDVSRVERYVKRKKIDDFLHSSKHGDEFNDCFGTITIRNIGNAVFSITKNNTSLATMMRIASTVLK
jgi:hypothetical protein